MRGLKQHLGLRRTGSQKTSHSPEILHASQLGILRGEGRVYLTYLLPPEMVGEPAPTGLLRMLQDVS